MAGLWILNRLRSEGYRVLLIERDALGAGQTLASQGVLHGGIKYTLQGKLTDASETIRGMPDRWAACLDSADGEIDLRSVPLLARRQVLWSSRSLGSRLATFFGSRMLQSRVETVTDAERPEVFRSNRFRGNLYWINERVIDTRAMVEALAAPHQECFIHGEPELLANGEGIRLGDHVLRTRLVVLAAGQGNAALLAGAGHSSPAMQRRPLHQVVVKRANLPDFFSVCLGGGAKPRIVSTTHPSADGQRVWYLGGDLAETGVARSETEQIAFAKSEIADLLPWVDLRGAEWSTLRIDRAEPETPDRSRPSGVFCQATPGDPRVLVTWPTKLVLTPLLADTVTKEIQNALGQSPPIIDPDHHLPLPELPRPAAADFPW